MISFLITYTIRNNNGIAITILPLLRIHCALIDCVSNKLVKPEEILKTSNLKSNVKVKSCFLDHHAGKFNFT